MTNANDIQVGGTHYASEFQHWDFAIYSGNRYLEACISAYVTRWRKKEGVKDLHKAEHFLDKLLEAVDQNTVWPPLIDIDDNVFQSYVAANELDSEQAAIVYGVHTWSAPVQLQRLRVRLANYVRAAEAAEGDASPAYVGQ